MGPDDARRTWRTLEPLHGLVYFAPEATEAYEAIGLTGRSGYFASRSAPMGAVATEVVMATFFNFEPGLVRRAMHGVWERVTPAVVLEARVVAVAACLGRALGDLATSPAVVEAGRAARVAAEHACEHPSGKPLFAGHASLDWPDDPLLVLWHAQTLLREFRGDLHIAAMTAQGIDGCEALVTHAAAGDVDRSVLQSTRAWSDEGWEAAEESLRAKGHLDADGAFTEAGRASRQWVEDRTDEWAAVAYAPLGADGCAQLRDVARPLSRAAAAAFRFPPR